ncbi:hypothetical protein [Pseudarthrobacter sp. IC2-21]|uniref:acyltransferase n=1 Tax=Pseudarthrobacter sp. IC2-21 TaxID=3092262 RepID=UPI002A69A58D|nr:hypothetical protein [Pseudarthrobacter sp. IC2-21]
MKFAVLLVGLLPSGRLKNLLLRKLNFEIHSTADISACFLLGVRHLCVGSGARIGTFTVLRGMKSVILRDSARIGQLNWISAAPDLNMADKSGTLILGEHSAITNRHYLDCSGGVEIGSYSTIAGVRSTLITHGINWRQSEQSVAPIRIGSYCIISSNVNLTPGTVVPDRSVVGMGVTVDKTLSADGGLIVSARGETVKENISGKYFEREVGVVKPPQN